VLPNVHGDKVAVAGDPRIPIRHLAGVHRLQDAFQAELDAMEAFASARLFAISKGHPDQELEFDRDIDASISPSFSAAARTI
jgi:uncharacterized MAPEG superfamily protein